MVDVNDYLKEALMEGIDEKIITFFDIREGLNDGILKKFCKETKSLKTYYLCFNSAVSSKKSVKTVLAALLKSYQIHFLGGQVYYFDPADEESVSVYAFGNDEVIIHFILSDDLQSIEKVARDHQNVIFCQSGYSRKESQQNFGKFIKARLT